MQNNKCNSLLKLAEETHPNSGWNSWSADNILRESVFEREKEPWFKSGGKNPATDALSLVHTL